MATDQECDRVSARMHSSAVALYRAMMDVEPQCDDPDIQAAAINGMNGAVAALLWQGRGDNATPDQIADNIRFAAHDLLTQMQRRERN